ncbi:MAG: CapA family protein [Candidatus Dojkabacteria bacterium]|nr:MAG: CapA family protein [Candidatus Dojkabacteria bacterium]
MELDIISLRKKQRVKYIGFLFSIGLIAFVILAVSIKLLYNPVEDKNPAPKNVSSSEEVTRLCLSNYISTELEEALVAIIGQKVGEVELLISADVSECDISIVRNLNVDSRFETLWSKLYVLTTSHGNPASSVTENQLGESIANQGLNSEPLIWSDESNLFVKSRFESISGQQYSTDIDVKEELISDNSYGLLPFSELSPSMVVIPIDGNSPLDSNFDIDEYPLVDSYSIYNAIPEQVSNEELTETAEAILGHAEFNKEGILTAYTVGSSSLAQNSVSVQPELLAELNSADILVAHEDAAYFDSCNYLAGSLYVCGETDLIDRYTELGVDALGVTGNHILDFGHESFSDYLESLTGREISYFGGGANASEALTPLIVEQGGHKVAVLGFNMNWPTSYYARSRVPGSASPDFMLGDGSNLANSLKEASLADPDLIIVQFHWGGAMQQEASQLQRSYAHLAIDNGADIVVGVNPTYVGPFEVYKEKLIAYSLGNLLMPDLIQKELHGAILKSIYYDGELIAVEVIPLTIQDGVISKGNVSLLGQLFNEELAVQLEASNEE